jgi:hypothetical protein
MFVTVLNEVSVTILYDISEPSDLPRSHINKI